MELIAAAFWKSEGQCSICCSGEAKDRDPPQPCTVKMQAMDDDDAVTDAH